MCGICRAFVTAQNELYLKNPGAASLLFNKRADLEKCCKYPPKHGPRLGTRQKVGLLWGVPIWRRGLFGILHDALAYTVGFGGGQVGKHAHYGGV